MSERENNEGAPYFSVIIPAYNCAEYLRATLASVQAQEFTDHEVLVVDDGSTDGTAVAIAEHAGWVRRLQHEGGVNRDLGATRNRAADAARGRYFAMLDADDLWYPWTLRVYREAIERHGEPAFLAGARTAFDEGDEPAPAAEEALATRAYRDFASSRPSEGHFLPSAAVIRADVWREAGGFWEERRIASDIDMWMRCAVAPGFVRIDAPPVVSIRRGHASMSKNAKRKADGLGRVVELEKEGFYPGGDERAADRRAVIADYLRRGSLYAAGFDLASAWKIYRLGFGWNARGGRWGYLAAFPVRSLLRWLRGSS